MITIATELGSVALKEMWDNYREGVGPQGPYVDKSYLLEDYSKRQAVLNAMRGVITLSGSSTLSVPPHECPDSTNLHCVDAWSEPQGEIDDKAGGRPRFNQAIIRARYGVIPYTPLATLDPNGANSFPNDVSPNQPYTYALCRMRVSSEIVRVPGSAYTFASAPNLPVDTAVGISVGVADLVFTRKFVPKLPMELILSKINGINSNTMFGQPVGTIMFRGADTEEEYTSNGGKTQQLVLYFKWREHDWNRQHRPDENSWDKIEDSTGSNPYTYRDLRPLLTALA